MLLDKFNNYVKQNKLCTPEDKVLLTVSGGVDSMVMLSLFARSGYNIGVAHCNFQLRGIESDEDEVLVEKEAQKYNVPFYNIRFDTQGELEKSSESLQMVARRLRYAWFDQLCSEHGYTHIAIAHQADDSVETFFINLIRGTGLRGLTGINVVNGKLIRPLLFSPRKEIVEYAISNDIHYREDSSNSSTKYLRNKIRLGIVPRIREISPNFTDTMTANVERLTDTQKFIDRQIDDIRNEVVEVHDGQTVINVSKIDEKLPLQFVLFELMYNYGFNGEVIDNVYHCLIAANGTGKRFYSRENVAYIDRGKVVITSIPDDDDCCVEVTNEMDHVRACGFLFTLEHFDADDIDKLNVADNVAFLDEDKLQYPLKIRRWSEGDSFMPLGMTGRKKVSDFLINKKISIPDKKRQLVVLSGDDLVWLVDRRIDDRYKVEKTTERVLKITKVIR